MLVGLGLPAHLVHLASVLLLDDVLNRFVLDVVENQVPVLATAHHVLRVGRNAELGGVRTKREEVVFPRLQELGLPKVPHLDAVVFGILQKI